MSYVTRLVRRVSAPPSAVYQALVDPEAVGHWMVPDGMTGEVHRFEPREGGRFRISLTYQSASGAGKSTEHTDSYQGWFETLRRDERVVQRLEFESDDPAMRGEMTLTITLREVPGGTEVTAEHAGVPDAIPPADNQLGWELSLAKLARLVEPDAAGR